jgi:hypothetical protein
MEMPCFLPLYFPLVLGSPQASSVCPFKSGLKMKVCVWNVGGMITVGETKLLGKETYPNAALFTTNPTYTYSCWTRAGPQTMPTEGGD